MPADITAIVFWTRDATPLIPHLKILDKMRIKYLFLWTLNNYPDALEPIGPKGNEAIDAVKELSEVVGRERIRWRYDPIVISDITPIEWHRENFSLLAQALAKFVDKVIVSVMTPYKSVVGRMQKSGINFHTEPYKDEKVAELLHFISNEARRNGLQVQSCCSGGKLLKHGIVDGACIDPLWIESVFGEKIDLPKDTGQRPECLCVKSVDIGTYNTCKRKCIYCYARR